MLALILALTPAAACTSDHGRDDAASAPRRTVPRDTIEATDVGARLIVTAIVAQVLTPQSFVVEDADLPEAGLLVLSEVRSKLSRHDLVTIDGSIDLFDYARFAERLTLTTRDAYREYDGQKVLVAVDVSSHA
jgi:hypothetical protein